MTSNAQRQLIELQDVVKVYQTGEIPFTALDRVNLDIWQGEFLGITGKSGAGKTTLLNMISGVSDVSSGNILFHQMAGAESASMPIHTLDEDRLARWRGQNLGIIYQSFELMPTLDLVKNVMLPPDFLDAYQPRASKERALELLELVDIAEHAYKIPAHISGGQKQRVAIARALVNDPQLIIADEPTGNLDSVTAETIFQIFEKLVEQGKTVVMVTHDESFAPRFTRRLQITDGVVSKVIKGTERAKNDAPTVLNKSEKCARETSSDSPAIVLRGVDKVYENAAGKFVALKSVNLQLDYGQFISIVGKSGCGKSTLLNMITGIDHPTAGETLIGGEDIYKMSESERSLWRGKNLGVVFQFFQLLPTLTLLENVILPMDYCNLYSFNERPQRAMDLLKMVGLEKQADKLPTAVSSGQQQSAAIARSLATDPSIILADEPTGNLDSKSAENVLNLFEDLAKQGKTILIVTHDPSITQRTDQTIILSDGEVIDQAVARALPFLSHAQMLEATKEAEKRKIAPGVTILKEGEKVEHFFMVTAGDVDIIVTKEKQEIRLAQLGCGQFFGEIELRQGENAIAQVRASSSGAEVALLPKKLFFDLVDGSALTRRVIEETASARLSENRRRKSDK